MKNGKKKLTLCSDEDLSNEWTRSIEGISAQLSALTVPNDVYEGTLKKMEGQINKRYETITSELEGEEFDVLDDFVDMKRKMNKVLNICRLVNSSVEKQINCVRMSVEKLSVLYGENVEELGEFFIDLNDYFDHFDHRQKRFARKAGQLDDLIGTKKRKQQAKKEKTPKVDKKERKKIHMKKIEISPKPPKKRGREDNAYEYEDIADITPKKKPTPVPVPAVQEEESTEYETVTDSESEYETVSEEEEVVVPKKKKKKKEPIVLPTVEFSDVKSKEGEGKGLTLMTHYFLVGQDMQIEYGEVMELRKLTYSKNKQEVIYEVDIHDTENEGKVKKVQFYIPTVSEQRIRGELVQRIIDTDKASDSSGEEEESDGNKK